VVDAVDDVVHRVLGKPWRNGNSKGLLRARGAERSRCLCPSIRIDSFWQLESPAASAMQTNVCYNKICEGKKTYGGLAKGMLNHLETPKAATPTKVALSSLTVGPASCNVGAARTWRTEAAAKAKTRDNMIGLGPEAQGNIHWDVQLE
jgi:hypothetical protein